MCKWGDTTEVRLCKPKRFSGKIFVAVDSCIASIVQALNSAGIETTGSCCGHDKGRGSITLADGRELLITPCEPSPTPRTDE